MSRESLFKLSIALSVISVGMFGVWSMSRHLERLEQASSVGNSSFEKLQQDFGEARAQSASAIRVITEAVKATEQPSPEPEVSSVATTSQNFLSP
ncbi:MAG: hypothetical protein Q8Q39_02725 [bacterium]|nr:hypothetical protein [bacterium]